jgi:GMP synthase (glutamine-hydrolysing)
MKDKRLKSYNYLDIKLYTRCRWYSRLPVIITPLHFDRDPAQNLPSCQRSIAIRTFITNDFMTGVPATPGVQFDIKVII